MVCWVPFSLTTAGRGKKNTWPLLLEEYGVGMQHFTQDTIGHNNAPPEYNKIPDLPAPGNFGRLQVSVSNSMSGAEL